MLQLLAAEGPPVGDMASASDLIGEAAWGGVTWLAIPVARLTPGFLGLSTRMAGEFLQKCVNYRLGVAIVGDVSAWTARSEALAAFVRESNRGRTVWFVLDEAELRARLFAAGIEV